MRRFVIYIRYGASPGNVLIISKRFACLLLMQRHKYFIILVQRIFIKRWFLIQFAKGN
ncbi:hypothetical protein ENTCAN_06530 [Enterobacter cancerogenus ATCC 35316]|nr:hypothetical protein ENTCAN_06530 [Enterobacter cancerogenus ATCC 35316]